MEELARQKQQQFKNMFFTLKLFSLLFCLIPIIQKSFSETGTSQVLYNFNFNFNFSAIFITILFLGVIIFIWYILDKNRNSTMVLNTLNIIEICMFFSLTTLAVYMSGQHESSYKYLFIFIILSTTIQYSMMVGMIVSGCASLVISGFDTIFYESGDFNPYFQSDIALIAMFFVVAWVVGYYVKIETQHIENLNEYANIDGLTGLYNHRYFHQCLRSVFQECKEKNKENLSLMIIDIDYFKSYNDAFGHQAGDELLKGVSELMKKNVDNQKWLFRFGGDEFCIILRESVANTKLLADDIRNAMMEFDFQGKEIFTNNHLSVSIGISQISDQNDSHFRLIERADAALYKAKYLRKNRTEIYSNIFDQFEDSENGITNDRVKLLITAINSRDSYTYTHIERVVNYCDVFAEYLGLDHASKQTLIYGAYLHDLGKINVPKEILIKDTRLTEEEWHQLQQHPIGSAELINQIAPTLTDVALIASEHHERFDGNGYPLGKKAEGIQYLSRVLTIADSFDAMISKRPYKTQRTYEDAFIELRRCSGTQFDPTLVEPFIDAVNRYVANK